MIIRIPLVEFQDALYILLTSYEQEVPVYDDVPAEAVRPYITFGGFTCKQNGSKDSSVWDISQQIHIWSEFCGKKEVNSIANDISSLITCPQYKLNLATAHFNVQSQDVDFFEAFEEEHGGYHGIVTCTAKISDLGGI